ncbi:5-oxoprolinase/urea amidolyase family protein [Cellulomonas sp. JZ18]|uniref:5-oxoprolinase subunit B/C family protein n=1 Tax=Cellulomonas sp. JZ18 TaxID=2654191 RepID=UPI0018AF690A|nr:5-oxoprolinase/urea amidolyase family protein [Cellulomonas sp. JZ18]
MTGSATAGSATAGGARLLPYGDDAVLVELDEPGAVRAVDAALRVARPPDVVDVVPAARTVLVRGTARTRSRWAAQVRERVLAAVGDAGEGGLPAPVRTVEVPVVYDGEDLAEVAALTRRSVEEVVARHLAGGPDGYRVAFGGFMPGFAYVVGLDPVLHVPRHASPRTRVPAGAVAVAGEYTAVYPAATPGGWRLLGTTTVRMFDPDRGRDGAALLTPGDAVRFVRAAPSPVLAARAGAPDPLPAAAADPAPPAAPAPAAVGAGHQPAPVASPARDEAPHRALTVLSPGPLTLVQDAGRAGLADVGVPRSGAADPDAARLANRLVGNAPDAPLLEVVLGGLVLAFGATTAVALTGARAPARLDGAPVRHRTAVRVPAGATLVLDGPAQGLRTWVAVRGGVDVPPVLGSCAHDQLSGLGSAPLRPGDVLAYGTAFDGLPEPVDEPDDAHGGVAADAAGPAGAPSVVELPAVDGPRLGRLDEPGRSALWRTVWTVTPASNRVAVRLDGPPLTRGDATELASEGVVAGAVQVPHDGRPVLFGPDHPVTGGYPVVAVLTREGRARAAQVRPGDHVRLVRVPSPAV